MSILLIAAIAALTACSGKNTEGDNPSEGQQIKEVPVTEIQTVVKEAYGEDYIPNMPYDETALLDVFGIDKGWCEEYLAEGPMISAQVDTFVAVKAKNGKTDDVEQALNKYRDSLVEDTLQYPANQVKIQASQVVTYGNYVFFIMLGNISMDIEEEEAMLTAYSEENQKAVVAIEGILLK